MEVSYSSSIVAVASQEHRTQKANRDACEARLAGLLDKAWDPPKARRQRSGLSETGKRGRTEGTYSEIDSLPLRFSR